VLDFATFDLEREPADHPRAFRRALSADTLHNPLVLIANYVFDTTAQDAFWVHGGRSYRKAWSPHVEPSEEAPRTRDARPAHTRYERRPVGDEYYEDEAMNRVLDAYRTRLGNTSFLFPIGALKGIRNLMHLAGGRLLLLPGQRLYPRG